MGVIPPEEALTDPDAVERRWAEGAFEHLPEWMFDDLEPEELERVDRWWARFCKMSVSPGAAAAIARMGNEIDIPNSCCDPRPTLRSSEPATRTPSRRPGTWPSTSRELGSWSSPAPRTRRTSARRSH